MSVKKEENLDDVKVESINFNEENKSTKDKLEKDF